MCQYTDRKPFNWHIVELVYWHIIKKQPAYKPGSVLPFAAGVSVIYLVLLSPVSFSGLPPGIGRAILHAPVYMTLQPIRRTASYIAIRPGELLPHLFTLTGQAGGRFLLRYSTLTDSFPLRSMVLFVARTFLPS